MYCNNLINAIRPDNPITTRCLSKADTGISFEICPFEQCQCYMIDEKPRHKTSIVLDLLFPSVNQNGQSSIFYLYPSALSTSFFVLIVNTTILSPLKLQFDFFEFQNYQLYVLSSNFNKSHHMSLCLVLHIQKEKIISQLFY